MESFDRQLNCSVLFYLRPKPVRRTLLAIFVDLIPDLVWNTPEEDLSWVL